MIAELHDIESTSRVLFDPGRYGQVYTPRFSPDGRQVVFSVWTEGGYRDIYLIDLESQNIRKVTHDRALDTGPTWSPDGHTIYFSSDRTGINNVYRYEVDTEELVQVTNVVAGAFHPAISPDGKTLVYVGYTHLGFDLYQLDLDKTEVRPAPLYVDNRPTPSDSSATYASKPSRYRPFFTLYPRNYSIDFNEGALGREVGISVSGADAVGLHSYSARVGFSLNEGYANARMRYTLHRSLLPLQFSLSRSITPRAGLIVDDLSRRWLARIVNASVATSYTFAHLFSYQRVGASYGVSHIERRKPFGGELDPNTSPPTIPRLGFNTSASLYWMYSDARKRLYDMTMSAGRTLVLNLFVSAPALGSTYRSVATRWSIQRYVTLPFRRRPIFALNYSGGISNSEYGPLTTFAVGGFPQIDFLTSLIDQTQLGGMALRGYAPVARAGSKYHLIQSEYRMPITRIQRGPQTVPLYVNRLYASAFFDAGTAYFGPLQASDIITGAGVELFADFTVGYQIAYTLRAGFAYGFQRGGGPQFYVHFGVPF
ncbi:MAG: hypothetical protein R3A47_06955 [Polyangiales bacterium]